MIAMELTDRVGEQPLTVCPRMEMPGHDRITPVLKRLAQLIQRVLPLPHSIAHLELNCWSGVVQFTWEARRFIVTPSLEAFELKGRGLSITTASMLIRRVLTQHQKNLRVGTEVVDSLERVENLLTSPRVEPSVTIVYLSDGCRSIRTLHTPRLDEALALLESVKQTIRNHLRSRRFLAKH
jgi:hypothetical protein